MQISGSMRCCLRTAAFIALLLRRYLHVFEVAGLVVDADLRRGDPAGELARLGSSTSTPFGVAFTSLNSPIWRWKVVAGSSRRNFTPVFSMILFQRSTPLAQSAT